MSILPLRRTQATSWRAYYQRLGDAWLLIKTPTGGAVVAPGGEAYEHAKNYARLMAHPDAQELGCLERDDLGFITVWMRRHPGRAMGWAACDSYQAVRRPFWRRLLGKIPSRLEVVYPEQFARERGVSS